MLSLGIQLGASVRELPYIGPYFTKTFRDEGVNTLGDLVNLVQNQTKAQNVRFLRKVLQNPRQQMCVGEPRYNQQTGTYARYCVRRENKYGWRSVIEFLLSRGVDQSKLPLAEPERGKKEKCKGDCDRNEDANNRDPIELFPKRYKRIPRLAHEHAAMYLLRKNNQPTSVEDLWKKTNHNIAQRNFAASLRMNSRDHGRALFNKTNDKTNDKYTLKPAVFALLQNLPSSERQLKYIREL